MAGHGEKKDFQIDPWNGSMIMVNAMVERDKVRVLVNANSLAMRVQFQYKPFTCSQSVLVRLANG